MNKGREYDAEGLDEALSNYISEHAAKRRFAPTFVRETSHTRGGEILAGMELQPLPRGASKAFDDGNIRQKGGSMDRRKRKRDNSASGGSAGAAASSSSRHGDDWNLATSYTAAQKADSGTGAIGAAEPEQLPTHIQRRLASVLSSVTVSRPSIKEGTHFVLSHATYAAAIGPVLLWSLSAGSDPNPCPGFLTTPIAAVVARLYLLSDVLCNSGNTTTLKGTSAYRVVLEKGLLSVFCSLRKRRRACGRLSETQLTQRVRAVLAAWRKLHLFSGDFLQSLSTAYEVKIHVGVGSSAVLVSAAFEGNRRGNEWEGAGGPVEGGGCSLEAGEGASEAPCGSGTLCGTLSGTTVSKDPCELDI